MSGTKANALHFDLNVDALPTALHWQLMHYCTTIITTNCAAVHWQLMRRCTAFITRNCTTLLKHCSSMDIGDQNQSWAESTLCSASDFLPSQVQPSASQVQCSLVIVAKCSAACARPSAVQPTRVPVSALITLFMRPNQSHFCCPLLPNCLTIIITTTITSMTILAITSYQHYQCHHQKVEDERERESISGLYPALITYQILSGSSYLPSTHCNIYHNF